MAGSKSQEIAAVDSCSSSNADCVMLADKRTSFDGVSIAFHWLTAVMVLSLITTAV